MTENMGKMTEKRKMAALKQAVYYRNYRRARDSALVKLSQLYPDDYLRLLKQERKRYEEEGKSWIDISGRTNAHLGVSATHKAGQTANGLGNSSEEGDLG